VRVCVFNPKTAGRIKRFISGIFKVLPHKTNISSLVENYLCISGKHDWLYDWRPKSKHV